MIARYFIARPILACVCSAFIVIAGVAGYLHLPRAQWPNIQPREILVDAAYPGANAETIANAVAAPLEQAIGNVSGLLYTQSVSAGNGSIFVSAIFGIDANIDAALLEVNSRVQEVQSRLPEEVRRQGVTVSKASASYLLVAALSSPDRRFDLAFMNNYARLNVVDELRRLPGVGDVSVVPQRYYSLRIWLQPDKLARLGLAPADVLRAVREQNSEYAAGRIGDEPMSSAVDFTYSVVVPGRLSEPAQFEQIIVQKSASGAIVRLKDVARVELGAARYDSASKLNGEWALPMSLTVRSDANAIDTGKLVRARLDELSKSFPAGLVYTVPYDSTIHVQNAIDEVSKTLVEALVLVFIVVFLFMGAWRVTLIPMLAVPVSIMGTFAVMFAMGFSINTITLFGAVFAIGIVVDDAIVVMENVQRLMLTQNLDARAATERTMDEVTRPVIAIVLVLVAVFMPVAFVEGLVGTIYRQFAITIAGSVVISGFVALTMTPALCATLLRAKDLQPSGWLAGFNRTFANLSRRFADAVAFLASRRLLSIAAMVAMVAVVVVLAMRIPTSLVPSEDRALVFVVPILPDGASMSRSQLVADELTAELRKHPAVKDVVAFTGVDGITGARRPGGALMWVALKPWRERRGDGLSPADVVTHIEAFGKTHVRDAQVIAFEPSPITGGSSTGGFEGFIQARTNADPQALAQVTQRFVKATEMREELRNVSASFRVNEPQMRIHVDRDKAKMLGVNIGELFATLQSNFGALYVNDFNYAGRVWQVQVQADAPFRARVEDLRNVFVRADTGTLVPISSLVRVDETTGPELMERYNGFPAARVYGRVASGHSSGSAYVAMEEVARQVLPDGYVLSWSGSSYQERVIGSSSNGAFLLSVLMVFLILAAQYERLTLPLAVIFAVPFAVFGAYVAIWLRGLTSDIFFQIGLVTLVGLSAKNGVLIVEYATHLQAQGMNAVDAALEAARLRFRPIVMTSAAFVFGVLPLLFATGAGANSRHSIGTGVVGGMIAATFISTLFVPLLYIWIAGRRGRGAGHETRDTTK